MIKGTSNLLTTFGQEKKDVLDSNDSTFTGIVTKRNPFAVNSAPPSAIKKKKKRATFSMPRKSKEDLKVPPVISPK